jgi:MraZ protein
MEFFDHFEHTIDDKGRLVLPAAYREAFAGGGFVARLGGSAGLFTRDGWEKYKRRLELEGVFSRDQLLLLFSLASPFTPDSQHRIAIGQKLRDQVGLERLVTIVGTGSHAAVYPRERWDELEARAQAADETGLTLDEKFDQLGFV